MQLEWTCLHLDLRVIGAYIFDYPRAPLYLTLEASISSILWPSERKFSCINRVKGFVSHVVLWNAVSSSLEQEDLWKKYVAKLIRN